MKYGEPWRMDDGHPLRIMDAGDYYVTGDCLPSSDLRLRRTIACVNACVGIDDPAEALRAAREAMEEMAEYLDQRADADCTDDGHYVPNEEMALHTRVADALRLLTP